MAPIAEELVFDATLPKALRFVKLPSRLRPAEES